MAWVEEADGVFRGGGVKGIGIAGALEGFAADPRYPIKRWVNVAGASAGAIIASFLAVKRDAGVAELGPLLENTPFATFEDYPRGGRIFGGVPNLFRHHGMARGEEFRKWMDGQLGGATFGDVKSERGGSRLKMVTVDVTNGQLLLLPDDLPLYRLPDADHPIDPDSFPISSAVRMSMSIPYLFEPVQLVRTGTTDAAQLIDGGTLSNFPVWIFDVDPAEGGEKPKRLTFGFTLTGGRSVGGGGGLVKHAPWPVRFGVDIVRTAMSAWDTRFASHSTRVRTVAIDALDVGTTEFKLTPEKRQALIDSGRKAVSDYLAKFDPAKATNTHGAKPEFLEEKQP
jgi:NTE family protein